MAECRVPAAAGSVADARPVRRVCPASAYSAPLVVSACLALSSCSGSGGPFPSSTAALALSFVPATMRRTALPPPLPPLSSPLFPLASATRPFVRPPHCHRHRVDSPALLSSKDDAGDADGSEGGIDDDGGDRDDDDDPSFLLDDLKRAAASKLGRSPLSAEDAAGAAYDAQSEFLAAMRDVGAEFDAAKEELGSDGAVEMFIRKIDEEDERRGREEDSEEDDGDAEEGEVGEWQ